MEPAGNLFGMVGMAIAIVTTLAAHPPAGPGSRLDPGGDWARSGGSVGALIPARADDGDAELVAAFHSLVGVAAVLVAAGALYAPSAFDIGSVGAIHKSSLVEM